MEIEELLKVETSYIFSVNDVSISYFLQNITNGNMCLSDFEEKEVPIVVSIYKILKGFPIQVVSAARFVDGKTYWDIVIGNNDIQNILKWVSEDIPITINDKVIRFSNFNEEEKKWFLEKNTIVSTIIDYAHDCDKESIPKDYLANFIQDFC